MGTIGEFSDYPTFMVGYRPVKAEMPAKVNLFAPATDHFGAATGLPRSILKTGPIP
jgi:hypothetical protein